jgi:hypothetical protein
MESTRTIYFQLRVQGLAERQYPIGRFVSAPGRVNQRPFDVKYVRGSPGNGLPDGPLQTKCDPGNGNRGEEYLPGEAEQSEIDETEAEGDACREIPARGRLRKRRQLRLRGHQTASMIYRAAVPAGARASAVSSQLSVLTRERPTGSRHQTRR